MKSGYTMNIDSNFGDFRDWFLTKEDKKKEIEKIYHTGIELYINKIKILKDEIPINFDEINFEVHFESDEDMNDILIELKVPEMNILRKRIFNRFVPCGSTCCVNFDFSINKGGEL